MYIIIIIVCKIVKLAYLYREAMPLESLVTMPQID